ncbi:MAG TPA: tryptophan synthase subunit alpha [Candidatus Binatia bacterium]|nr:tryptophan synthase subunit alpha [Candidatus Binatia bacterium]
MSAITGTPGAERFQRAFGARPAGQPPGVIPYATAGFPERADTTRLLLAFQAAGALAVEVGIPFSDPLADGPTIQRTGWRALEQGMTPALAITQVGQARSAGLSVPLAVMTYVNPVLAMGLERFVDACAEAGVDGVIVPDLPVEEASDLAASLGRRGLAHIPLVAPTTPTARLARVAATAAGFVYCVSVTGVTGARARINPGALLLLDRVRLVTALPRALGFGISQPEHVAGLSGRCEAVVVASALLDAIAADPQRDAAEVAQAFVRWLRGAGGATAAPAPAGGAEGVEHRW